MNQQLVEDDKALEIYGPRVCSHEEKQRAQTNFDGSVEQDSHGHVRHLMRWSFAS